MRIGKGLHNIGGGTEQAAFLGACSVGVITHLFALTNVLHNYDDIRYNPVGYGSGVYSGRFMLKILGDFSQKLGGNVNLPLINGLLFIALIAVSAGFLVNIFSISSKKRAAALGALLAVFPTTASTLIHRFTAVYYGVCILLAVLAAWVLYRSKFGFLWSALCTAASLAFYQALVPVTIAVFVLLLIQQTLRGDCDLFTIIKRGLYDCAALILGVLLYFLLMKLSLRIWNMELVDYQGINNMGQISLTELPALVAQSVKIVCKLPLKDFCGLSSTLFLRGAYLLLGLCTAGLIGFILVFQIKKVSVAILTAVLSVLFLLAVNFIYVMCPDSSVYTLMVYSFSLLAFAPVVVLECLPQDRKIRIASKGIALGLLILIGSYSYLDNVNYTATHYANRQVENYMSTMIAQIRMTDGFDTEKEWAFIGGISDPLLDFTWEDQMSYGGFVGPETLLSCFSTRRWVQHYYGYFPIMASDEREMELCAMEQVKNMPVWPNAGSIQIIGNTIVIKCQELPLK